MADFKEAEIIRGEWVSPMGARVTVGEYTAQWIRERPLQPRTRELYVLLLRLHVAPFLGPRTLDQVNSGGDPDVAADATGQGRSEIVAAKAYRLLRAVLNTAVREDRLIERTRAASPASTRRVRRASRRDGRPGRGPWQVLDRRYRALVFVAAFTGLRWGELVALRCS